jgi:hypothetical protein
MTGPRERSKETLAGLQLTISKWDQGVSCSKMLLLHVILETMNDPTTRKISHEVLNVDSIGQRLGKAIASAILRIVPESSEKYNNASYDNNDSHYIKAWIAFDVASLDKLQPFLQRHLLPHLAVLENAQSQLAGQHLTLSWRLKTFLAQHLQESLERPREIDFAGLFECGDGHLNTNSSQPAKYELLLGYLATVTNGYSQQILLSYLKELLTTAAKLRRSVGQVLAIHYVVERLLGICRSH